MDSSGVVSAKRSGSSTAQTANEIGSTSVNNVQAYPEDDWMREMGPTARVWCVYNDETEIIDAEIVEGYISTADVLLVFVGFNSLLLL